METLLDNIQWSQGAALDGHLEHLFQDICPAGTTYNEFTVRINIPAQRRALTSGTISVVLGLLSSDTPPASRATSAMLFRILSVLIMDASPTDRNERAKQEAVEGGLLRVAPAFLTMPETAMDAAFAVAMVCKWSAGYKETAMSVSDFARAPRFHCCCCLLIRFRLF